MPPDPSSFLPLKPVELLLLLSLVDDERHGYALTQDIAARSDDAVRLEPGNLYRVIKRLVDDGLVAPAAQRATKAASGDADERRQYYRITALGKHVVLAETQRLRALLASRTVRALRRAASA